MLPHLPAVLDPITAAELNIDSDKEVNQALNNEDSDFIDCDILPHLYNLEDKFDYTYYNGDWEPCSCEEDHCPNRHSGPFPPPPQYQPQFPFAQCTDPQLLEPYSPAAEEQSDSVPQSPVSVPLITQSSPRQ